MVRLPPRRNLVPVLAIARRIDDEKTMSRLAHEMGSSPDAIYCALRPSSPVPQSVGALAKRIRIHLQVRAYIRKHIRTIPPPGPIPEAADALRRDK